MEEWFSSLCGVDPRELLTVAMYGGQFNSAKIGGEDVEMVSSTGMQLLRALHDDTTDDLIAAHPAWVSSS